MTEQPKRSIYGDSEADSSAAPKPIGLPEQISGVFQEPAKLFSRLAERPQWVGALILSVVFALVFTIAWLMGVDAREVAAVQIENSGRQMSSQEMEQAIELGSRFMSVGAIFGTLVTIPFFAFLFGAINWAIGLASRGNPQWRPTYQHGLVVACVPALATLPYSLLGAVMAFIQPAGTLRPDQMVPSSLGYWIEAESPKLSMLLYSLDVFQLFHYVVIFFAARYALRAKHWGAALCVAAALLAPLARILFAK
jgi:hypothetical protein